MPAPRPVLLRIAFLGALWVLPAAAQTSAPSSHSTSAEPHRTEAKPPSHHPAERRGHTATHAHKPTTPVVQAPKPSAPKVPAPAAPETAAPTAPAPAAPTEPTKGTVTGLPLPRFVSLRADEVYLRSGPGMQYPIEWVYKRRDLPVEIEREFDVWRLVEDSDGVKGWMHQATLTGRRTFVVTGAEQTMRASASDTASAVAKLMPGVVGRLRRCDAGSDWCEVQVKDYRGWLKRSEFWGTLPGEAVQP